MLILQEGVRPRQKPIAQWGAAEAGRPVNYPVLEDQDHYLVTVHGFSGGGFEATVKSVNLQTLIDGRGVPRGARRPVDERSMTDVVRSVNRAKAMVRRLVREMGADHLLTLTTREDRNTPESLAAKWKAFVRRYRFFAGDAFDYVAVPERHPKNPDHWHLHVATRGFFKLKQARPLWWALCGGRGMGNIDVQHVSVGCDRNGIQRGLIERSCRIARYLSKYMTKDLVAVHRPDKKRYWRSEFDEPGTRRFWLLTRPHVDHVSDALDEVMREFGVSRDGCSFFVFPDGRGVWIDYNPQRVPAGADPPIPF